MSSALEPVEDVSAAGVIDLVKGMSVRLLHGHGITERTERSVRRRICVCVSMSLFHCVLKYCFCEIP